MAKIESMPKYDSYKDSGFEWIGKIPLNWDLLSVKHIYRLVMEESGKNHNLELLSVYSDIGVKPRAELEEKGNKASSTDGYWLVKKGDFVVNKLLAWMGGLGLSMYDGVTSPAYDVLRPKRDICGRYFNYLFRSPVCTSELKKHSRGIMDMRLRLYFDKLGVVKVPFPKVEVQTAIANFLDKKTAQIDGAIAIKEKQIELLKERKQIIIQQAVTQGLNPDAPMKDSGVDWIGEIPEQWVVKKMKTFARIKNGVDYKHVETENGYPVYGSGGQFTNASSFLYEGEAVLLGRKGTIDKPLYVNEAFWTVDTMFYAICNSTVLTKFVYYCATTIPFKFYSTATALPSMTQTDLLNHKFAVPNKHEQSQIVNYIENKSAELDEAVILQQRQIEKLKEYKTTLINSAVTGKIKVPKVDSELS